jgi:hypothetical protein
VRQQDVVWESELSQESSVSEHWWLTPVIQATWEAEIGRIVVQLRGTVCETQSPRIFCFRIRKPVAIVGFTPIVLFNKWQVSCSCSPLAPFRPGQAFLYYIRFPFVVRALLWMASLMAKYIRQCLANDSKLKCHATSCPQAGVFCLYQNPTASQKPFLNKTILVCRRGQRFAPKF